MLLDAYRSMLARSTDRSTRAARARGEAGDLTAARRLATMAAMTRDLLLQILQAAPGLDGQADKFETQEGHRVSFYLGQEGRGIVVNEILAIELADGFVHLSTEEQGEMFVPYDGVHSMAVKPLKEHAPKRTGFA